MSAKWRPKKSTLQLFYLKKSPIFLQNSHFHKEKFKVNSMVSLITIWQKTCLRNLRWFLRFEKLEWYWKFMKLRTKKFFSTLKQLIIFYIWSSTKTFPFLTSLQFHFTIWSTFGTISWQLVGTHLSILRRLIQFILNFIQYFSRII